MPGPQFPHATHSLIATARTVQTTKETSKTAPELNLIFFYWKVEWLLFGAAYPGIFPFFIALDPSFYTPP